MTTTIGIDVGSGVIKTALFRVEGERSEWVARWDARIRQRDPYRLVDESVESVLRSAGLKRDRIDYIATTGEGESVQGATGHFYTMTTHARGALYLDPEARAVLDIGALNGRAIRIDERGKVLSYRMTSQCASGSGQFLENISRYLGISQDEIGTLSQQSKHPEKVSSICAVLAETDVINMVSRSIPPSDILRGIHESMAERLIKLLKSIDVRQGVVMMTGGLALDTGLVQAIQDGMDLQKMGTRVASHPDSLYAGAIGAALWGAFRHRKLQALGRLPSAS
ncbi:MAG: benzoyl-CoA reductase subunit D [Deltaproteobacteria bacterium]|nr:benzoyl-CoA reductase subunit D [Deltaproteobacteria bacterium]PWB60570.1 MAG: benzoyl-CoA reductase subunit D [Deltaproteobacteria bacterium]